MKDHLERFLDLGNFFGQEFPDLIPVQDVEGRPHVLVLERLPLLLRYRRVVQGPVAHNLSVKESELITMLGTSAKDVFHILNLVLLPVS